MAATQACHNCRRQRLKCDRALPQCNKCVRRGQECLGYERLLRWTQSVASRGKMAWKTFEDAPETGKCHDRSSARSTPSSNLSYASSEGTDSMLSIQKSLTDPLMQDVNLPLRSYLLYFASDVCKDLVLYDTPKHNPFRELFPMAHQHPILLQVIIANSALHMSNALQAVSSLNANDVPSPDQKSLLGSAAPSPPTPQPGTAYRDALMAKQRALFLLQIALGSTDPVDIDVILAVVLLFIEFELLDSGRNNWSHHIKGARMIIEKLCESNASTGIVVSPLRSCLISNCLVFDILGSTTTSSIGLIPSDTVTTGNLSLLLDEEGNHCSSLPVTLLQLIRAGAQISQSYSSSSSREPPAEPQYQQALNLLHAAESFDPLAWATQLQPRSPTTDVHHRTLVASAYRAAVRIYLSRVLLLLHPTSQLDCDLEGLVSEIITHGSSIYPTDVLFTATTWPAFLAGAETDVPVNQEWVKARFQELWKVEPWGLMKGALEVLDRLWAERRRRQVIVGEASSTEGANGNTNWLGYLRGMGVDWLIV